ncbi:YqzK family protein [Bacillus sp. JCM 19034]|uniref:YqzK family protein n=1 Tax=Bacillus sp. JCM 19034 TaxID=1481928 RepID=UPI000784D4E5|nr:YqzK family protein [Bacillus sp. JCM 19034]
MKTWLQAVLQTLKVFILFMGCTLLFYYGILWVSQEYESYHRYDEPEGKAVKVFQMEERKGTSFFERLIFFYQEGE